MLDQTMAVLGNLSVIVQAADGNLRIRSGGADGITVQVPNGDDLVTWEREEGVVTVAVRADATLTVPPGANAALEEVLGNLRIQGIKGRVRTRSVHGNATVRGSGPVSFEQVLGNLRANDLTDDLTARDVRGNVWARRVGGTVMLRDVGGNLEAEAVEGGLTAENVRGNVSLLPPFSVGSTYRVTGFGNLRVSLPPEASVRIKVRAGGHVDVRHPALAVEWHNGEALGTLGAGQAALEADVKGNVMLLGKEPGRETGMSSQWEELGAQIEWQVHDAMATLATELEERLGRVDGEWVRHQVDGATVEARRRAERAAERARMRAEQAERRWRRAAGERVGPQPTNATDEERLRVLRMVEDGTITPEQGADLLGAIEGR